MSGYMIYAKREAYSITPEGLIGRPAINLQPSDKWILRGLVRLNNFGNQVDFVPFDRLDRLADGRTLTHKNGKPQWFMADIDRGTRRLMMEGVWYIVRRS